jgi:hypothetical protein
VSASQTAAREKEDAGIADPTERGRFRAGAHRPRDRHNLLSVPAHLRKAAGRRTRGLEDLPRIARLHDGSPGYIERARACGLYLWAQPRVFSDRHQTPGVQPAGRPTLGRPTLSRPTFCHATLSAWLGQSDSGAAGERGQRGEGARAGETWRMVPDPRVLGQSAVSTSTCSQAALVRERIRIPARMLDDGQFGAGYGCAV